MRMYLVKGFNVVVQLFYYAIINKAKDSVNKQYGPQQYGPILFVVLFHNNAATQAAPYIPPILLRVKCNNQPGG